MKINRSILTLEEFRKQELRFLPNATGELSSLLQDIALAAKRVNVEVNKAGLEDILGDTGNSNVQGERVKKLDEFAHDQFVAVLRRGVSCAGIVSEESDGYISFDEELCNLSKYVVVLDPLDGSSNIDVNISIGTIFGIYRRISKKGSPCEEIDFLQKGERMIAAGYIIYGSSTMLVYATRRGVNGFTLDPAIGEFTISHPDIKYPKTGNVYSVNQGNYYKYSEKVRQYIDDCQQRPKLGDDSYNLRYTGTLVADMHRNLLKGGIFLYPATYESKKGKLRLLYECNPFAFILEVAGGSSTDGENNILEIQPEQLHERTPFFAGSNYLMKPFLVQQKMSFYK